METRPEVLTVREVAEWLRVSEQTILRELLHDHMDGFKVRGAWRIRREAVETYMSRRIPERGDLSTVEVAKRIGRSRETAWRLMQSGAIVSTRRGKGWFATPEAVDAWLADHQ